MLRFSPPRVTIDERSDNNSSEHLLFVGASRLRHLHP
ncbi:hypothetical protein BREVUG8_60244 [Brevundimonas sp. G8]|nr:hypothetical protein BREVUG8_60244 [Brevundimonas sp. G8]